MKFSERAGTPAAERWSDLMRCEHRAGDVLREHGIAAADSVLIEADGRLFLQSTRFDHTPALGRRGFVSLAALDAAFHGHARIDWTVFADQLACDGWIDAATARTLRVIGWFGALIANSDMHLGNAALVLADTRPFRLAPVYDMLPMTFRPAVSGEIVERRLDVPLPTPAARDDWQQAAGMALSFWSGIAGWDEISAGFRRIAADAAAGMRRAIALVG